MRLRTNLARCQGLGYPVQVRALEIVPGVMVPLDTVHQIEGRFACTTLQEVLQRGFTFPGVRCDVAWSWSK